MLNISPSQRCEVNHTEFNSFKRIAHRHRGRRPIWFFGISFVFLFIILLLPWTQTIRSKGVVTTLRPNQRPQSVQSVIAGRIEEWFIQEGEYVEKGDTIIFISEIKDEYFDPELLQRTQRQIDAKRQSYKSYQSKVIALDNRITALESTVVLKEKQLKNKVRQAQLKLQSDSIDLEAAKVNYQVAMDRFERMRGLYDQGLKSLTDFESRQMGVQKDKAKLIEAENKWLSAQNELINAQVELKSVLVEYQEYIAKAKSERFSALSSQYAVEVDIAKLENKLKNYQRRQGFYYITAPQSGYITRALKGGIGETIKEGDEVVGIMPSDYELAVEMMVNPVDLPLLELGQEVRIQFDGWPAIVFSGWPNTSYGTYGGKVFAIENFTYQSGKYRVLVAQDSSTVSWPDALRPGGGTNNFLLLKDVPVWYEIWRKINGFPPDFYKEVEKEKGVTKKKKQ